jgi:hypothetical protein
MLEATVGPRQGSDSGEKKWVQLHHDLLAALVDRTFQDVSYLLGLPIAWEAVGAVDVPDTWRGNLSYHFVRVMVPPDCQPSLDQGFEPIPDQIGPTKKWVLQYKVHILQHCRNLILFLCLTVKIIDDCIAG